MSKLISLEAENFKRLKAVRIEPNGNGITVISGNNANGKSSVLDAIQAAIGGKRATPEKPIRDGQEKGHVIAELDDMVVRRTFTESGGTLTVTMADGAKVGSPQKILDSLFGSLTFDPLAFARMKPAEQMDEVKRVAGLDLSDLERKRDAAFDKRRDAKAVLKSKEAKASVIGVCPKAEPMDTDEIAEKLRTIRGRTEEIAYLETKKARLREDYDNMKERIVSMEAELAQIQEFGKEVNTSISALKEQSKTDSEVEAELTAKMDSLAETNAAAKKYEEYKAAKSEVDEQSKVVSDLQNELESCRKEISDRIAAVKLPISEMEFGDDGLLLNGNPFSQASQAEQIRASIEMGIGANPELRLMLVREGSLFDDEHLALLAKIAEENDVQVLIERVGTDSEVGIVIEDGEVRQ